MSRLMFEPHKIKKFHALGDHVVVESMSFDQRITSNGIILHSDNAKSEGIRPRWGKVYAIGPEQKELKVGQWVLVAHGRWTRGVDIEDPQGERTIRRVDLDDIMAVSDEPVQDDTMSDAISVPRRQR